MPYCITLRSRTDARITGWYAGRNCLWSTDHNRQKRFDNPRDASAVCRELRSLCPRNAKVINIEVTGDARHLNVGTALSNEIAVTIASVGIKMNELVGVISETIQTSTPTVSDGLIVAGYHEPASD